MALTYGNLLWSAFGSAVALGLDRDERWLCAMPVSHVGGLSILVRSAIYATTAVVHERFETDRVLHALRAQEVTLVSVVATTLSRLLDAGLRRPPRLRLALAGGGPVGAALHAGPGTPASTVSQTYGLTESGRSDDRPGRPRRARRRAWGRPPLFCTRLRIETEARSSCAGRRSRAVPPARTDGCGPATSVASTRPAPCT